MASPKKSVHTPSTSFYRSSSAAGDLLTASAIWSCIGVKNNSTSIFYVLLSTCHVVLSTCSVVSLAAVLWMSRNAPPLPPPPPHPFCGVPPTPPPPPRQKKNGCEGDNLFWRLVSLWLGDWTRTGLWTLEQKITPESPSLTTFKIL